MILNELTQLIGSMTDMHVAETTPCGVHYSTPVTTEIRRRRGLERFDIRI